MNNKLFLTALISIFSIIFLQSSVAVHAAQPFNVEIDLPSSYQNVNPGTDVWFTIKLLNLDNLQRVDVTLNYDILDSNDDSIIHNSKTVAIETQASFVADLTVPENTLPGEYSLNVVVNSSLGESLAKTSLTVSNPKTNLNIYYIAAGIVVLILLIFIVIRSRPLIEKLKLKMKIGRIVNKKLKK